MRIRSLLALCALVGCYNPLPQSGVQQCGPKGECEAGYYCAADGRCYKNGDKPKVDMAVAQDMATPCTADACKAASKVCDPETHGCVDCLQDGDCPLGKVCKQKACVDGCTDAHGCPTGMCVSGMCALCKNDGDCANDPSGNHRCDVASGKCVGCLQTADCKPGEFCDPGDHTCHPGCDTDGQCTGNGNQKCCNHVCYDLNSSNTHCGDCNTDCGNQTCCAGFCSDVTKGDINNCGACGVKCAGPHAMWACMGSMCVITGCNAGFNDCDLLTMDGCESAPATDVANCGMCGNKCTAQNATPACVNGQCGLGPCNMGFADCNNNPGDGCETNVAGDVNNCGGCGVKCALANATAACIGGACVIASCNMGFSNCDNLDNTGCEVSVGGDPNNCGGCGVKCAALPNVMTVACTNSKCTVGTCNPGFGNCNNIDADGCEVPTATDANNCGGCGKVCGKTANVATTRCVASACQVATCNGGFADCNATYGDGCEINTTSDKNNCSKCGMVCPMNQVCANSMCGGGGLCGNNVLDPGEERDPPPGPFMSAPVDAITCKWHFENVVQLYCNGGCSWAGNTDCDQADADIFCKLKTNNAASTATSFQVVTALAQPGFACPQSVGGLNVNLGPLPLRGVNVNVWYQDSSILANHGAGNVITNVVCK